ncbi:MAG TPA: response regulator [Methylomirabilota bacterium]|nr:response regulator [Methylomirabilota bacterium]
MPKVLVVDDSLSVRKVVQRALESRRIEVLSAASGNEALEQIGRNVPDLVVCDVIMPDMDGYQICDFVKKHPTLSQTPVLLISGIVNGTVLERAAKVRSDDVMRKPFAAEELLQRIDSLLGAQTKSVPAVSPSPPGSKSSSIPAPMSAEASPSTVAGSRGVPTQPVMAAAPAAPVAAAPIPTAPEAPADLKAVLESVAGVPGVSLTALMDREGALMEAAGGLLPEAGLTGALASCLVDATGGVGEALKQGRVQSIILEYETGVVLLNVVGDDAMLAVVLDDPAVLGKVRYHVKKALPDLVRGL